MEQEQETIRRLRADLDNEKTMRGRAEAGRERARKSLKRVIQEAESHERAASLNAAQRDAWSAAIFKVLDEIGLSRDEYQNSDQTVEDFIIERVKAAVAALKYIAAIPGNHDPAQLEDVNGINDGRDRGIRLRGAVEVAREAFKHFQNR